MPSSAHRPLTLATPLSVLPRLARYCRPTWAVLLPHLRSPCSSITSTPCACGAVGGSLQGRDAALRERLRIPTRLREEPRQALGRRLLRPDHRFRVSQGGQRL